MTIRKVAVGPSGQVVQVQNNGKPVNTAPAPVNFTTFNIVGWLLFVVAVYFISKSKMGYNIIYYMLALILIFLLVGNIQNIIPSITTGG